MRGVSDGKQHRCGTDHSKSLYMIVKKTWRNRLTAFISTANRYNHASPDIVRAVCAARHLVQAGFSREGEERGWRLGTAAGGAAGEWAAEKCGAGL